MCRVGSGCPPMRVGRLCEHDRVGLFVEVECAVDRAPRWPCRGTDELAGRQDGDAGRNSGSVRPNGMVER
jgi:hypothetical protein